MDEAESARRARRMAARVPELLAKSGIPAKAREARLAEIEPLPHQALAVGALRELLVSFAGGSRDFWVVLQGIRGGHEGNPGANGIGKTFLAGVFGAEVCRLGCPVEWWPEYKLVNTLYRAMKPDTPYSVGDIVERLCSGHLLGLDNMGTDGDFRDGRVTPVNEFLREKLAGALDTCMELPVPVLITTTLMPDEFEARYGHDIYSRVYGMCAKRDTWVPFSGPDLRKTWGE